MTYPAPGAPPPPPPYGSPPHQAPAPSTVICGRCGSPTPGGFAFCQQCGFKLSPGGAAAVDVHGATLAVSGEQAARAVSSGVARQTPVQGPPVLATPSPASLVPPQGSPPHPADSPGVAPGARPAPSGAAAANAWGMAVSVNRDGTDGERYPLAGDYAVIGRAGSDIAFDQDRFLAREHARLEVSGEAVRVVPIDTLNGVYRKIDAPVELRDGSVFLAGREVLRFEAVDAEEKNPLPLVRHGVALFGSPPREPWGRLAQLLPSGGVRDVRYLGDDEIVIGREEGDLVYADDAFLSRRHATVTWDGKRVLLTDLGSSNGTFVRLAGPHPVKHGEHLRMGDQLFRIELRR